VYTLILPLIALVPKHIIATADGEPIRDLDAEAPAPMAATTGRLES
jgi:hypothetical protein